MDKYEEAAKEFIQETRTKDYISPQAWVAGAMQFFDARREKETCEWRYLPGTESTYATACGKTTSLKDVYASGTCLCGRRIVEKEEK